jgi:hypothetical protein
LELILSWSRGWLAAGSELREFGQDTGANIQG